MKYVVFQFLTCQGDMDMDMRFMVTKQPHLSMLQAGTVKRVRELHQSLSCLRDMHMGLMATQQQAQLAQTEQLKRKVYL